MGVEREGLGTIESEAVWKECIKRIANRSSKMQEQRERTRGTCCVWYPQFVYMGVRKDRERKKESAFFSN